MDRHTGGALVLQLQYGASLLACPRVFGNCSPEKNETENENIQVCKFLCSDLACRAGKDLCIQRHD